MKAMKSWKKSIKCNNQPLLTYINAGILLEASANTTSTQTEIDPVAFDMSTAFKELESRLLSSLQEVIVSSIGSFHRI